MTNIDLFYSYSHADEELRDRLEKHLSLLKRQALIRNWHDRKIGAGHELGEEIESNLAKADIVLLLISADFLASDYCYTKEMKWALERHEAGLARVIPVILRPVDWHSAPFGKLLALPTDGKAVTQWPNHDAAFSDIARGIRKEVGDLIEQRKKELALLEGTVSNPRYIADLNALDGKYDLNTVINGETIIVVYGNTAVAELLDRPAAERLRDEIDKRGKPLPYRRAIVVSFHTWNREKTLLPNAVISVGGPPANDLTKELNVPPGVYTIAPGVYGSYRKHNGAIQVGLWGETAAQTNASVDNYIRRSDGLKQFLTQCWK